MCYIEYRAYVCIHIESKMIYFHLFLSLSIFGSFITQKDFHIKPDTFFPFGIYHVDLVAALCCK